MRSKRYARFNDPRYQTWRRKVLRLAEFRCELCGKHAKGRRKRWGLYCHHLLSWASHPESRFDVENGMALCRDCHRKRHETEAMYTYYHVVEGGFDWYGMDVTEGNNELVVTEGRLGLTDNPLHVVNGIVEGGWYLPSITIPIQKTDRVVDILLDKNKQKLVPIIRGNDLGESYDESKYQIVLTLAQRQAENQPWLIAQPLRPHYD